MTSACAIVAAVLLVLAASAVWAPAGIALAVVIAFAALAQGMVEWIGGRPSFSKRRPPTDIGDT